MTSQWWRGSPADSDVDVVWFPATGEILIVYNCNVVELHAYHAEVGGIRLRAHNSCAGEKYVDLAILAWSPSRIWSVELDRSRHLLSLSTMRCHAHYSRTEIFSLGTGESQTEIGIARNNLKSWWSRASSCLDSIFGRVWSPRRGSVGSVGLGRGVGVLRADNRHPEARGANGWSDNLRSISPTNRRQIWIVR